MSGTVGRLVGSEEIKEDDRRHGRVTPTRVADRNADRTAAMFLSAKLG